MKKALNKYIYRILLLLCIPILIPGCKDSGTTELIEEPEQITVGIQTFGDFDSKLTDTIAAVIKDIYGFKVVIMPGRKMPENAFITIKSPRYRADTIIREMLKDFPDSLNYMIGLTEKDISTTKYDSNGEVKKPENKYFDWGIFGLGFCPGRTCLVSIFRLKNKDYSLFIDRLKKVSIHELGHNLGLKHCPTVGCVMQDADETIKTIDNEKLELCDHCKKKIFGD